MVSERRSAGSSPLARGTQEVQRPLQREPRLIPARAGNTSSSYIPVSSIPAHPRSRGEHPFCLFVFGVSPGSSPLARGTPPVSPRHARGCRLIPARAGNTAVESPVATAPAAHPRSRGEHQRHTGQASTSRGSSPLARGTPEWVPEFLANGRLIPARAGNTLKELLLISMPSAHPRSRGEHRPEKRCRHPAGGSSPLARGTHPLQPVPVGYRRLIPARAGNTPLLA